MSVKLSTARIGVFVSALLLAASVYFLWLIATPQLDIWIPPDWNEPVARSNVLKENRLYIPKLKLNLAYKPGNASVLSNSIWHRYPERGDPEKGGNFILAGHRFELGLTPNEVRRKSPFYRIDLLQINDLIYVDYNGKRYKYMIAKRFAVKPQDQNIESASSEPKMTLYSCTLGGTWDGREVVVATLVDNNVSPTIRF